MVGSGASVREYSDSIMRFIKDNDVITFGCNNINHILIPDYHFWADHSRYEEFGDKMSKKSVPVFSTDFGKNLISKYCKRDYLSFTYKNKKPKNGRKIKIKYRSKIMYGRFRTVGSLAIFYAYVRKASSIRVVGMDGYTLYSENQLLNKEQQQHCYGDKGYTDLPKEKRKYKERKYGTFYKYSEEKDKDIYDCLNAMGDYGIDFKIITPTIYKRFYDESILRKYKT